MQSAQNTSPRRSSRNRTMTSRVRLRVFSWPFRDGTLSKAGPPPSRRNVRPIARQASHRLDSSTSWIVPVIVPRMASTRAAGTPVRLAMHVEHSDAPVIAAETSAASEGRQIFKGRVVRLDAVDRYKHYK